jgi:Uma2 family endonuclease
MNQAFRPAFAEPVHPAIAALMTRRWTVAEIDDLVERGKLDSKLRFELIDGEILPMAAKGYRHERLKVTLNGFWWKRLPDAFVLAGETTFRMHATTFVEPDFLFFAKADGLAGLSPATALLAVEVADSSLAYDRLRKARVYAAAGVGEVWVIDARRLVTHIFRDPAPGGYRRQERVAKEGTLALPFAPEVTVSLGALEQF